MTAPLDEDPRATNHAYWQGLATLHGAGIPGGYYDLDALAAGRNPLHDEVEDTLAVAVPDGVSGLDVLHVQCHVAIDSVELARRGARVTGADFSANALAAAADIAARCGVTLELVEADSTALPAQLHDRFDLAYATVGVVCWVPDLDAWMRSVAACLRPGGALVLVELHPLYCMTDTVDPLVMDLDYGYRDGGLTIDQDGSYADRSAKLPATRATCFNYALGEIVTAAVRAGLTVEYLREYTSMSFEATSGDLVREDDGKWRWRIDGGLPLPLFYGLVARKTP